MIESMNSRVDYTTPGTSYLGLSSHGKIMVGDNAFEFYNDKNARDFIQIPWDQIDHIAASVNFKGRWISRFVIVTLAGQQLKFSSRNNKKLLREVRNHFDANKIVRSLSFFDVIKKGLLSLFKRKK